MADSDFRIKSGILYTLYQATANGHTYLPEDELADRAAKLLQVEISEIDKHPMDMQMDKRLVIRGEEKAENSRNGCFRSGGIGSVGADAAAADVLGEPNASNVSNIANAPERAVYASHYYYTELNTARMLHDLNITGSESEEQIRKSPAVIRKRNRSSWMNCRSAR